MKTWQYVTKIASTAFIQTAFAHFHSMTCTEMHTSGMRNLRKENKINAESAAGVWKTERTQNTAGGTISDTKKKF